MSDRVFFDTNVLVYLHDAGAPDKQERARELVEAHGRARTAVLSTQVLQEFYVATTRKLGVPLSEGEAAAQVRRFRSWPLAVIDGDLVLEAIDLQQEERTSFWDALILVAARREGCAVVLSEDLGDGRVYGGVRVRNPFADLG